MNSADRQHIEQLAKELDVILFDKNTAHKHAIESGSFGLMVALMEGTSFSAPGHNSWGETFLMNDWQDDEQGYFVALHELGHQALSHPQTFDKRNMTAPEIVTAEVNAWQWALATANRNPSPKAWESIKFAINSYRQNKHHLK